MNQSAAPADGLSDEIVDLIRATASAGAAVPGRAADLRPVWETLQLHVPAWVEAHVAFTDPSSVAAPTCPQVVGVDVPLMVLRRARWVEGNLHLALAPHRIDPDTRTSFRVVGAEPRNWDVVGLDGVSLDLSTSGLDVRVPMVDAEFVLMRSSY
ncbi:MAG: hypothetical protein WBP59_03340 [Ilumatobacteraceae bacterium]